jgi:hypothetical protein
MNLNYSKGKKENAIVAVGLLCRGTRPTRLVTAQPTWPVGLRLRVGELAPTAPVDGGPAEFRRRPMMRCSGEGPGSKAVGWRTSFGAAGRKKLTEERCPWGRDSIGGERR